jgi:type II secretory pathway pseudopilin PulG
MKLHPLPSSSRSGYLLLEIIIAMTIFLTAIIALTEALQMGMKTAAGIRRDNLIRIGLRSFIEEQRRKQVSDMPTQTTDDQLGVTYSTSVDDLTLKNQDGTVLTDLYVLHAKAEWGEGSDAQSESVDLYLYEPSGQNINSTPQGTAASTSTTSGASTSGTGQ